MLTNLSHVRLTVCVQQPSRALVELRHSYHLHAPEALCLLARPGVASAHSLIFRNRCTHPLERCGMQIFLSRQTLPWRATRREPSTDNHEHKAYGSDGCVRGSGAKGREQPKSASHISRP